MFCLFIAIPLFLRSVQAAFRKIFHGPVTSQMQVLIICSFGSSTVPPVSCGRDMQTPPLWLRGGPATFFSLTVGPDRASSIPSQAPCTSAISLPGLTYHIIFRILVPRWQVRKGNMTTAHSFYHSILVSGKPQPVNASVPSHNFLSGVAILTHGWRFRNSRCKGKKDT